MCLIYVGRTKVKGNLKQRISHVELISAARRRVALNLDTLKFTDELGEIKEITDVSRVENEIEFKVNGELGKFSNLFEGYINEDNVVTLLRLFPEKIIYPDITIEL